jgi:aminopeptidase
MDPKVAARNALLCVLEARRGEKLTVIADEVMKPIGEAFSSAGLGLGMWTRLVMLPEDGSARTEIPRFLESIVVEGGSDIFVNLLRGRAEETPFRISLTRLEKRRRTRLGHCPGITMDMLTKGALALTEEEYRELQGRADTLLALCEGATGVHITNPDGTDISFSVEGRTFFTDTKLNWETLKWMNLPVGEVIVGPVEYSAEGKLVCNTAIGGLGRIKHPLTLYVEGGQVRRITCKDERARRSVAKNQALDGWASRIGEFAFGLNMRARMMDEFLETEKMAGTIHIAFGNNSDYPGGRNVSKTHQDFLVSKPTVTLRMGNEDREVLRDGRFVPVR